MAQEHLSRPLPARPWLGLPSVEPRAIAAGRPRSFARATTPCSSGSARSRCGRRGRRPARRGRWSIGVVNAWFVEALDRQLILDQARGKRLLVMFEELGAAAWSGVLEAIEEARLTDAALREISVRSWASRGSIHDHGSVADLRRMLRLDVEGPR